MHAIIVSTFFSMSRNHPECAHTIFLIRCISLQIETQFDVAFFSFSIENLLFQMAIFQFDIDMSIVYILTLFQYVCVYYRVAQNIKHLCHIVFVIFVFFLRQNYYYKKRECVTFSEQ